MGNQITCCRRKWSQLLDDLNERSPDIDIYRPKCYQNGAAAFSVNSSPIRQSQQFDDTTVVLQEATPRRIQKIPCQNDTNVKRGITQHINDREPQDFDFDPSLNASLHALFASGVPSSCKIKSPTLILQSTRPDRHLCSSGKKWSSCSNIFIGNSCLSSLNLEETLWSVSAALELLLKSFRNSQLCKPLISVAFDDSFTCGQVYRDVYSLFDERQFPIFRYADAPSMVPRPDFAVNPLASEIHQFIHILFRTAFLGPQCAIVALIFMERLINAAEVGLMPWSWRRQFLACVLLASKVLDDQAVWNTDYRQILRDVSVDDLNALERCTLFLLQFNIDVPLAVYTRYYFDLLTVGEAQDVANRLQERRLLTPELAARLGILSSDDSHSDCNADLHTRSLFVFPCTYKHHFCQTKPREKCKRTSSHLSPPKSRSDMKSGIVQTSDSKISTTSNIRRYLSLDLVTDLNLSYFCDKPVRNRVDYIRKTSQDKEGGLLTVDAETEFVNSLQLPSTQSSSKRTSVDIYHSASSGKTEIVLDPERSVNGTQATLAHPFRSRSYVPYARLTSNDGQFSGESSGQHSGMNRIIPGGLAPPTSLGFIRSVMGGEVAYSLLRDTGMY